MTIHERLETTLGDLITALYEEYLAVYGDEDLASVAVSTTINELLIEGVTSGVDAEAA